MEHLQLESNNSIPGPGLSAEERREIEKERDLLFEELKCGI